MCEEAASKRFFGRAGVNGGLFSQTPQRRRRRRRGIHFGPLQRGFLFCPPPPTYLPTYSVGGSVFKGCKEKKEKVGERGHEQIARD